MNTATFDSSFGLSRALLRLQGFAQRLQRAEPAETSDDVAALLRLADRYEDSQPSYAADLRAAALASQR